MTLTLVRTRPPSKAQRYQEARERLHLHFYRTNDYRALDRALWLLDWLDEYWGYGRYACDR